MTKREADDRIDAGVTWGELKTLLRAEMGATPRVSTLNRGMSHEAAVDILARAIEPRDDHERVGSKWGQERSDRLKARNVLRECAHRAKRHRYCEMCDEFMKASECPMCGAPTLSTSRTF